MDSVSGEEKVLPQAAYLVECIGARPHVRDDGEGRGLFIDFKVLKGPQEGAQAGVYVSVPQPGDRKAGYWYAKKMNGFGDLAAVYESMPDDVRGGLEVLCAAIGGKRLLADIGPGVGAFANRNSLGDTKPADSPTETAEPSEGSADGEENTTSTDGATDTSPESADEAPF